MTEEEKKEFEEFLQWKKEKAEKEQSEKKAAIEKAIVLNQIRQRILKVKYPFLNQRTMIQLTPLLFYPLL